MEERVLMKEYEENGIKAVVDHRKGMIGFDDGERVFSIDIEDAKIFTEMLFSVYIREGLDRG